MQLSLLQPYITPGDIPANVAAIQRLIDEADGDLLVLPEYALTGPITTRHADPAAWAAQSTEARRQLRVPEGRHLLLNALLAVDGRVLNCCELLAPDGTAPQRHCKRRVSAAEAAAGVQEGTGWEAFAVGEWRFATILCNDLRHVEDLPAGELDFLVWAFHFTRENLSEAMNNARSLSQQFRLPLFVCSPVGEHSIGHSAYVNGSLRLSLRDREGILEAILA